MPFNCTKISGPRYEIILREVLRELSTICSAFTAKRLSQREVTVNLTTVLLIRQSDSGADVCARVKTKGGHLEHKLTQWF